MAENNEEQLELPHESIKKSLEDIIKNKGFVNYEIKISPGCKKGQNFGGIVYKIDVKESKANGEKSNLNLFSKTPVRIEGGAKNFKVEDAFLRENKVYDEILKHMKKFEAEKGVEDGFTSYAECLATGSTSNEEFLIMEDITKRNFVMFDRSAKLDLNHTQLVMKALGKFHAFSFAFRDQAPEVLHKYSEELTEVFLTNDMNEEMVNFMNQFLSSAAEKLKFEGIYQDKWKNFHKQYLSLLKHCCLGKLAEPYAVVGHGDAWNNNMMFKYDNGIPTEVCLLDWQLSRYASPVLDIVYYLFCCTEKPFRDVHYKTLLDIYYKSLSSFLTQLGSDPEKLFPYSAFQDQLKTFGKYGLGMAILLVPMLVTNSEDAVNVEDLFENSSDITNNEKTLQIWTARLTDVVLDMVDLGYL